MPPAPNPRETVKQSNNCSTDASSFGQLFIVATPIGNLGDISQRALSTLAEVDLILAEDTRHSQRLLNHHGISTKLRACHDHNEEALVGWVGEQLSHGQNLALISDAGTPLISDPGFVMVRALRASGYTITSVPGPSALITALSLAGLPTDRFIFDGFLPPKSEARKKQLNRYLNESRTVVVYESSHRIVASLQDLVEVLGEERQISVARELTKRFETVITNTAQEVLNTVQADADQARGEFVLLIAGMPETNAADDEVNELLRVLLREVSVKQAASIASKLSGIRKNRAYEMALALQDR